MSVVHRVVLVDDENIIVRSLRAALPWDEMGMEVVADASNGKDGLRLIRELKPDIVISDIRMPVLDGIAMMKEALEERPAPIFVLLSGYSEFEYAREAVRAGAFDYLLKPVDHEELESVMREAKKRLEQEAQQQHEREYLTRSVQSLSTLVRERLVSLMLEGEQQPVDPSYWLQGWDLEHPYVMLVVALDDTLEVHQWSSEDRRLWFFAVNNVLSEFGQNNGALTVFPFRSGEWVVLLPNANRTEVERIAGEMIPLIKSCTKLACSVGVSAVHQGLGQLFACYRSAQQALLRRFASGREQVYVDGVLPQGAADRAADAFVVHQEVTVRGQLSRLGTESFTSSSTVPTEMKQRKENIGQDSLLRWELRICEAIAGFDREQTLGILRELFVLLRESGVRQPEAAAVMIELTVGMSRQLSELSREPFGMLKELIAGLPMCGTLEEMELLVRQALLSYIDRTMTTVSGEAEGNSIRKATDYMAGRFHYDLSMEEVSEFVGLSCSHFCVLFKKETGLTFLEYLTKLRVERACSILKNTQVKVYQIAPLVGYQDAKYFTQVFKKLVGKTPSEYRTMVQVSDS
ncbi:response regulator [Paenibacillus sp. YYML68]|uniref:response regulator n=1 Tax=Paenibacillus sp. YYML68 TaxID=2909250 RepID=UPI00249244DF|nr:response regulator [Paenibacillus sp. YYML68]